MGVGGWIRSGGDGLPFLVARKYVSYGGIDYARGALEKALGTRKAQAVLKRIGAQREMVLDRLHRLLADHLEDAVPILKHDVQKAGVILCALNVETASHIRPHLSGSKHGQLPQTTSEPVPKEELDTKHITASIR